MICPFARLPYKQSCVGTFLENGVKSTFKMVCLNIATESTDLVLNLRAYIHNIIIIHMSTRYPQFVNWSYNIVYIGIIY